MLLLCSKCTRIDFYALLLLLHLFNGHFFQQNLGKPAPERQTILDFTEAREDGGGRWHQLDHMQIICTSLQINNHHSVFVQAGCRSCRPTNSVKALKALLLKAYTFSHKNP